MRIVGGLLRGKTLSTPLSSQTRPTSDRLRETLFNILAHHALLGKLPQPTTRVLDAFAGTGALGLEALSRGAGVATFVDQDITVVQENIRHCHMDTCSTLIRGNFLHTSLQGPYNLVFLDPPYGKGLIPQSLAHLLTSGILGEGAVLVLEFQKTESFKIPEAFSVITERTVSLSKVMFLKKM